MTNLLRKPVCNIAHKNTHDQSFKEISLLGRLVPQNSLDFALFHNYLRKVSISILMVVTYFNDHKMLITKHA